MISCDLLSTFFSAILSQFSQPSAMRLFKQHVAPEQLQGVMTCKKSTAANAAGGRTFGEPTGNLRNRLVAQYCPDAGSTGIQRLILSVHSYRHQHHDDKKCRSSFHRPRRRSPLSPVHRDDGRRYEYWRGDQACVFPVYRICCQYWVVFSRSDAVGTVAS